MELRQPEKPHHTDHSRRMTVRKAFRYRLYPNREQEAALAVQFGHARFVYNFCLATRKEYYREHGKGLHYYDLKRRMTAAKKSEFPWLADADSQVLQAKVEDWTRAASTCRRWAGCAP